MQKILLLHGALGAERQMQSLKTLLEENFEVYSFSFEGHGDRQSSRELRIQFFSENLRAFLKENQLEKPRVFGYSMGGYVAIYTEALFPGTFEKIITLGTKFAWTPEIAAREVRMLQPDIIEDKVPKFAAHLDRMHTPNDWKLNMKATAEMMEHMGAFPPMNDVDLAKVKCPVQLLLGAKDTMVTMAETVEMQQQLPNAFFDPLDDVEHPIEKLNLNLLLPFL